MFIQTEIGRDPATMKFLPDRAVLPSRTVEFGDADSAKGSPLATRLFAITSVRRVVLGPDFVTVTKGDETDWSSLKPAVLVMMMEHFATGAPVFVDPEPQETVDIGFPPEDSEVAAALKELIETRIRPTATQSGGDVAFRGFRDGIVYLAMEGGAFALKDRIAMMLRHYVPEVQDVRDYRDAVPKPGLDTPEAAIIRELLDDRINPAVAAHGGHVSLVDVVAHTAYIRLEGGCQGCGMADVTLKKGIEIEIKRAVPAIAAVLDTTDHAGGRNPYYQPGKGGASPF